MHVAIENILSAAAAKEKLLDLVKEVEEKDLFLLTQNDKPVAAIVSLEHLMELAKDSSKSVIVDKPSVSPTPAPTHSAALPSFKPLSPPVPPPPLPPLPSIAKAPELPKPPLPEIKDAAPPKPDDPLVTQSDINKVVEGSSTPPVSTRELPPVPPLPKPPAPPLSSPFSNVNSSTLNSSLPPKPPAPSVSPATWPPAPSATSDVKQAGDAPAKTDSADAKDELDDLDNDIL